MLSYVLHSLSPPLPCDPSEQDDETEALPNGAQYESDPHMNGDNVTAGHQERGVIIRDEPWRASDDGTDDTPERISVWAMSWVTVRILPPSTVTIFTGEAAANTRKTSVMGWDLCGRRINERGDVDTSVDERSYLVRWPFLVTETLCREAAVANSTRRDTAAMTCRRFERVSF